MLAVIRLRGKLKKSKGVNDTLKMLGLKKKHNLVFLPENETVKGMLKKTEAEITWGEVDESYAKEFSQDWKKATGLKPPRKGFRSLKKAYPKGDLGYRGDKIKDLIERMK